MGRVGGSGEKTRETEPNLIVSQQQVKGKFSIHFF